MATWQFWTLLCVVVFFGAGIVNYLNEIQYQTRTCAGLLRGLQQQLARTDD